MSKNKRITNAEIVEEFKPILQEIIAESGWTVGPNNKGSVLFTTPLLKHKKQLKDLLPHPDPNYVLLRTQKSPLRIIKPVPAINKYPSAA